MPELTFTIALSKENYETKLSELRTKGILLGTDGYAEYLGVAVQYNYVEKSRKLTVTVVKKPMLVGAGMIKGMLEDWFR